MPFDSENRKKRSHSEHKRGNSAPQRFEGAKKLGQKAQEASIKFSWENHGKEIRDAIVNAYISYSSK